MQINYLTLTKYNKSKSGVHGLRYVNGTNNDVVTISKDPETKKFMYFFAFNTGLKSFVLKSSKKL